MNPGDLCICGHTREVHFGHECSKVDCNCKQFVECGLAVPIFQALQKAAVLVRLAYKTPQWLNECRSMESDDALDLIEATLRRANEE